MKDIKCLVEFIDEEMNDAEKYAKKATHYKYTNMELADAYAGLAAEEIHHADILHEQAVRLIEAHKASGGTVPESMKTVWDWEHDKAMDHKSRVKIMLDMYKA